MYTEVFIKDLSELGRKIASYSKGELKIDLLDKAIRHSYRDNTLFTKGMQLVALTSVASRFLDESALSVWLGEYSTEIYEKEFEVMIVMAGNIPAVGFHDLLTVLASGRIAVVKLSGSDKYLIPALCEILFEINDYWRGRIHFRERPDDFPAMLIATGGDESAAYFRGRYPGVPSLIRGAKCSVAVLKGDEDELMLDSLAQDLFLYFGLGCRNVSTLLIPYNYDIVALASHLSKFSNLVKSDYYHDAYRYQKAISTVSGEWFMDVGFFIFRQNSTLPPPMSVVGIVKYKDEKEIESFLVTNRSSLQCVVNFCFGGRYLACGSTQFPTLTDYADEVNSLEFILKNS